nr:hypothetical protein [Mesorhizobium sp.]
MSGEIIAFFASRERDPVRAGVALDHLRGELIESGRRLPIELDGRLGGITDQQVNPDRPETTFVYLDQRLVIPAFAAQLVNTFAFPEYLLPDPPEGLKAASTKLRTEWVSPVASTVRLVVLGHTASHSCVTVFSWILRLKGCEEVSGSRLHLPQEDGRDLLEAPASEVVVSDSRREKVARASFRATVHKPGLLAVLRENSDAELPYFYRLSARGRRRANRPPAQCFPLIVGYPTGSQTR